MHAEYHTESSWFLQLLYWTHVAMYGDLILKSFAMTKILCRHQKYYFDVVHRESQLYIIGSSLTRYQASLVIGRTGEVFATAVTIDHWYRIQSVSRVRTLRIHSCNCLNWCKLYSTQSPSMECKGSAPKLMWLNAKRSVQFSCGSRTWFEVRFNHSIRVRIL